MSVTTGDVVTERVIRNDPQALIAFLAVLHQMVPPHPAHPL
jgi:hypothetical protein